MFFTFFIRPFLPGVPLLLLSSPRGGDADRPTQVAPWPGGDLNPGLPGRSPTPKPLRHPGKTGQPVAVPSLGLQSILHLCPIAGPGVAHASGEAQNEAGGAAAEAGPGFRPQHRGLMLGASAVRGEGGAGALVRMESATGAAALPCFRTSIRGLNSFIY